MNKLWGWQCIVRVAETEVCNMQGTLLQIGCPRVSPASPRGRGARSSWRARGTVGKLGLMAPAQPRSPRASGAPRLAGSREAWGKGPSKHNWDREQFDKSFKKRTRINSYDNKDTGLILNTMSYPKLLLSLRMPRRKETVLVAVLRGELGRFLESAS